MVEFSNEGGIFYGKQSRDERGIHISGTGYTSQSPPTYTFVTTDTQDQIRAACAEISEMLCKKNRQYGDSALDPVRIFSRADTVEQLKVRIDDKLSRLARGDDSLESDDEILNDLIGYLILLKVARDS